MRLVAAGLACGPVGLDLLDLDRDSQVVELLLDVTLVAVLVTDACAVRWSVLRRDDWLPPRLFGLGPAMGAWLLLLGLSMGKPEDDHARVPV